MLKVNNLNKTFGDMIAVDNIEFSIQSGEILGLIGQNGAGKTTTFRLILNLLKADSGEVLWNDQKLTKKQLSTIGYLPEERGLYPKVTIEDQIIYFAQLRGKKRQDIKQKIDFWMEKFDVKGKKTDKIKTLSKGNQQKVQLISTLIHEPQLIILDEPFSGLDPVNADLLIQGILDAKQKGASIIFSSHNMNNVEDLCDKLIMLRNGKQVLDGRVRDIRLQFGRTRLTIEGTDLQNNELLQIPGVLSVKEDSYGTKHILLESTEDGKAVFDLATKGKYIPSFNQQPPSLEEIFKEIVGEKNER